MKRSVLIWISVTLIAFLAAFETVDFLRHPENVESLVAAVIVSIIGARILLAGK